MARAARHPPRAVLEDSVSELAHEVRKLRAQSRHKVPRTRAVGNGTGLTIRDAKAVHEWSKGRIAELEYEEAWVLVINRDHKLIRAVCVEKGDTGRTHLDPERVLDVANAKGGAGFILVHNHPSDIPKPGKADIEATQLIHRLAKERGLRMLDSVVVGRTTHRSIADMGLMRRGS